MAEQIRIVLTVDDAAKKMIEDSANEYCGGNISAYVRGIAALHQLLQNKDVGTDIPGWMLRMYPLRLITQLSENIAAFHKNFARKHFYDRVAPPTTRTLPIEAADANKREIRVNELARELEVKAVTIIELLPTLGVKEKITFSSSIPGEIAAKVRQHFRPK